MIGHVTQDRETDIVLSEALGAPADIHRVAGEIALTWPEPDAMKAEAYFERALAIARKQAASDGFKLEALFAAAKPPFEDLALLAELLSLPLESRYPPLSLTPQARREKTFAALLRQLEALTRRHPVLLIFEDLHWEHRPLGLPGCTPGVLEHGDLVLK